MAYFCSNICCFFMPQRRFMCFCFFFFWNLHLLPWATPMSQRTFEQETLNITKVHISALFEIKSINTKNNATLASCIDASDCNINSINGRLKDSCYFGRSWVSISIVTKATLDERHGVSNQGQLDNVFNTLCKLLNAEISKRCMSLRWRHNGRDSVSNHQPHHCILNRLFRRRSKKTSKLRVTGLCVVNSPHKWPVTRKMFPLDDVIMWSEPTG